MSDINYAELDEERGAGYTKEDLMGMDVFQLRRLAEKEGVQAAMRSGHVS